MKILIAVLSSLLITLTVPVVIKDCSGNSFLDTGKVSTNPYTIILAYSKLINTVNKPCVQPTIVKRTLQLHKWQDASGVWHYSDSTSNNQSGDNGTLAIESTLYSNEEPEPPVVKAWLPFALIGFCLSLCGILYLLMFGIEMGLQFFRKDETDSEATTYYERQTAGEPIEFFNTAPYEVLGISAKATLEEAEAAYERQLSYYHKLNSKKTNAKVQDDNRGKLIALHQAFEAIKRKKQDKFLATTD